MRLHNIVVKDIFGHLYRLHLPHEAPIHRRVEPRDLRDKVSAHTFVWQFLRQVDDEQWLRILHSTDFPPNRRLDRIELHDAVIKLVMQGIIKVYPLHLNSLEQQDHYLLIDTPDGLQHHFIPSSLLAVKALPDVRFFNSEPASATQFVEHLALTDEQLADVIRDLPLFFGRTSAKRATRIAGLVDALCDGKVAVVTQRPGMTPPKKSGPEDLPVEYYTPKPYTLGPHEEPGYVPPVNPHSGLHNQEELTPDRETSAESFKPIRQVDMKNLSPEDDAVEKALERQGWNDDKVKQVLKSGDNFTEIPCQEGDKLYGFNTAGRARNLDNSAYLLDEAGMADVKAKYFRQGHWDKEGVKDYLALPCFNAASSIDVMEVTEPTTGIQSTIGKATELLRYDGTDGYTTGTLGKIMGGGGTQITLDTSSLKLLSGK